MYENIRVPQSVCVCVSVLAYISISYGMCIFGSGQEILVPFSAKVCFKGCGCHGSKGVYGWGKVFLFVPDGLDRSG